MSLENALGGLALDASVQELVDYDDGEVLAEVAGSNAVITFTFASPVELVVAESFGDGLVSRADPFGGTPTSTQGIPLRHEVPLYIPVTTAAVDVWIPMGAVVNLWGFRR